MTAKYYFMVFPIKYFILLKSQLTMAYVLSVMYVVMFLCECWMRADTSVNIKSRLTFYAQLYSWSFFLMFKYQFQNVSLICKKTTKKIPEFLVLGNMQTLISPKQ